jgi:hypothetical protein
MSQNENTKPSAAQGVLVEVADALRNSSQTVRSRLVTALTERELVKRVDLLDKGLAKLKEVKKEVDKIRPADMFDGDGNKVPGHFTKQQHEELKKAKEKFAKLEKAVEKAFAGEEFDKLANLVAGKGGDDEDKGE